MNMKQWLQDQISASRKRAMPVLSFPSTQLLGVTVRELISDSDLQAKGMKAVADRCDTAASVSLMDLSVEAEAFGAQIRVSDDEVPTVMGSILPDEAAVAALKVPEVGTGRTGLYIEAIQKAVGLIPDRPVLAGVIGPFSLAGRLMDMTEIMGNCYDEPEMVHATLEKVTDFLLRYVLAYKAAGAHGVVMAEPAAGLLSPALMGEFSAPYVKKIVDAVQDDSFLLIYHNCGPAVNRMIPEVLSTGAAAFHFGNAISLAEIAPLIPADVPFMGNVDPVSVLRNGTPDLVREETLRIIGECCQYPNFIISSGCDIPPVSPWENIDAFFRTVADYYA